MPALRLATYHLNVGALKDAEEAVKGALSVSPADAQANRAMALLMIGSGRAAEAEPYVKATVAKAGTPEAELSLADYYLRMNRPDAAKPILERLEGSEKVQAPGEHQACGNGLRVRTEGRSPQTAGRESSSECPADCGRPSHQRSMAPRRGSRHRRDGDRAGSREGATPVCRRRSSSWGARRRRRVIDRGPKRPMPRCSG